MARSRNFNLTAEINLRGPANIRTVVANIRRQLGSINANVNVNVSAAASRSITGLNTRLRTLNGTLANTVTNVNNVTNAINALSTAMRGIPTPPTIVPPGLPAATRDVRAARTEMEEFGRQTGLAIRRFAAFSVGTAGIYALVNAARQGVESFISFNKEMVKLQQVTGESQTSLKKVSDEITTLSTSLGVASSELLNVATTLAQAGLSAKDTEKALKALALSSLAPSFDDMNSTVEGSIALMKQFGISAGDLEGALGSINSVAAKFAVEAGDIIAAIQRTGGVFASASRGVSEGTDALNEFIAVFTSVRATTRESAETIATGLRTIFTRIQRAGTIEALKDFGIVLTDAEGKFVGAYKAIELLSQGLNKLDPRNLKFSEIVEELGGFRQIGKVIPLIQQFATAQQALLVAQKGSGSLAEDAATAQLSLANQIAKVREEFFALFREIGGSDSFQVMAKATLELASGLIKVADAAKGVLPIVGTILALRGLQGAGQFIGGFRGGLGRRGAANGGIIRYNRGGTVPAMVSNGEAFVPPETVRRIGVGKLKRMNQADRNKSGRYAGGGGIQVFKGPGSGTSDSIGPIGLPAGSFIIREKAIKALGYAGGGSVSKLVSRKPSLKKFYDTGSNLINDTYLSPIIDRKSLSKSREKYRKDAENIVDEASNIYKSKGMNSANKYIREKTSGFSANLTKKDFTTTTKKNPRRLNKVQGALAEKTVMSQFKKLKKIPYAGGADFFKDKKTFIEVKNKIEPTDDSELIAKGLLAYAYKNSKPNNYLKNNQKDIVPPFKIILKSTNPKDMSIGGMIQKFMAGEMIEPLKLGKIRGDITRYAITGAGVQPDLKQALLDLVAKKNDKRRTISQQQIANELGELIRTNKITPELARQKMASLIQKPSVIPSGPKGIPTVQAVSLEALTKKDKRSFRIDEDTGNPTDIIRSSPSAKVSQEMAQALDRGVRVGIAGALRTVLQDFYSRNPDQKQAIIDAGATFNQRGLPIPSKAMIDRAMAYSVPYQERGLGTERLIGALGATPGPRKPGKSAPVDFLNLGQGKGAKILADIFGLIPDLPVEVKGGRKATSRKRIAKRARALRDIPGVSFGKYQGGLMQNYAMGGMPKGRGIKGPRGSRSALKELSEAEISQLSTADLIKYAKAQARDVFSTRGAGMVTRMDFVPVPKERIVPELESSLITYLGQKGFWQEKISPFGRVNESKNKKAQLKTSKESSLKSQQARMSDEVAARSQEWSSIRAGSSIDNYLLKSLKEPVLSDYIKAKSGQQLGKAFHDTRLRQSVNKALDKFDDFDYSPTNLDKLISGIASKNFASGGEIPIMAQKGEYVINKQSAKSIGYDNLHKLNKYHDGGVVGQGAVQSFAGGGMPDTIGASAYGVNSKVFKLMDKTVFSVLDSFRGLGRETTQTQQIFSQLRTVSPGLVDAIRSNTIANNRTKTAQEGVAQNYLNQIKDLKRGGASGAALNSAIRGYISSLTADTAAKNASARSTPLITKLTTTLSSTFSRLSSAATSAASAISNAASNMRTRFLGGGGGAATPPGGAPPGTPGGQRGFLGLPAYSQNTMQRARALRAQGLRGQALRDRMSGGGMGNAAFALSFALPVINEMVSGSEEPTSAGQASSKAFSGSLTTGLGGALAIGSMGGPLGIIGGLAVAAGSIVKAFADAENAVREFNIKDAGDKLNNQLELTNKSLDKFGNNLNDAGIRTKALEDVLSSITKAQAVTTASESRKVGVFNLRDTGGDTAEGQFDAFRRSVVLFDQGITAYINTLSSGVGQENAAAAFAKSIPKMARERATSFGGASQSTTALLETEIKRTGSLDALKANTEEFKKLTSSLALADIQVQEQILRVQNNNALSTEEKKKTIESIIAREGESKAIEISNRAMREKAIDELNKAANKATFSLELMFTEMEQSINASNFAIDKLKESSDLAAASLSGQAKIGQTRLNAINVLQNPRAYSSRENNEAASLGASAFGSDLEPAIKGLLRFGPMLQDTVMSTINQVLTTTPKEELNNEVIASKISRAVRQSLDRLQLPPELASKLSNEVGKNIEELRKSGQDKVDFSELAERIPALSKVVESAKRAQETAIQALENWQKSLNTYSEAFNTITSLQIQNNERLRRSSDILYQGQLELGKAFGKSTDLRGAINNFNATVGSMSGGLTAVGDIAQEIQRLERVRQQQQNLQNDAANRGIEGAQDFMLMTKNLKDTNTKLRESYSALELLSNSSEVAAAAMSKIAELQQKQQAGIGIMEKIVTSTPEELANFGNALQRLQVNMMGGVNIGSTSEQRGETLQAFNMIAPLLGDAQGALRANVLEGMLREVNAPLTPFFSNILESLRNPDADPEMKAAIDIYKQSLDQQVAANAALNRLNETTIKEGADFAAKQIVQGLQGTLQTFQNRQLENIAKGISDLAQIFRERLPMAAPAAPAVGRALGGIIYADGGAFVPRGTDTVPAMLTPGEFVVNKRATQKNLPLLKSINSGSNGYSRGGTVYLASGGLVSLYDDDKKAISGDAYEAKKPAIEKPLIASSKPLLDIPLDTINDKLNDKYTEAKAVKPSIYANSKSELKPLFTRDFITTYTEQAQKNNNRLGTFGIESRLGVSAPNQISSIANDAYKQKATKTSTTQSFGVELPKKATIDELSKISENKINFLNQKDFDDKIEKYKLAYNNIINALSNIKYKSDSSILYNGKEIFSTLDLSTDPLTPTLSFDKGTGSVILDNLSKISDKYIGPILFDSITSSPKIHSFNPFGFAIQESIYSGTDFKPSDEDNFLTISRFSVTAGANNIGATDAGANIIKVFGNEIYKTNDITDLLGKPLVSSDNAKNIQTIVSRAKNSLDILNSKDFIKTTKSDYSAKTQETQKILNALYNNQLFKYRFSSPLIDGINDFTLYNIRDKNKWTDIIKETQLNDDQKEIELGKNIANVDNWYRLEKDKNSIELPWTKNLNLDLKAEEEEFKKAQNFIEKAESKTYTDKGLSFIYKKVRGYLFDKKLGKFDEDGPFEEFLAVPLGGSEASYAQNPFAETDPTRYPNRFAYYNNIDSLNQFIDKVLAETTKTPPADITKTSSILKATNIDKYGTFSDFIKENAFIKSSRDNIDLPIKEFIKAYNKDKNIKEIGRQFRVPGAGAADNNLLSALKTPKSLLDITSKTIRDPKIARIGGALKYPLFGLSRPEQLKNYVQYLNTISTNLGTDRRAGKLNRDNSVTFNENFAELYGMLIASKDFFSALDASDIGKISNIIGADISGFVQGNNIAQGGMDRIIQSIKNRASGIKSTVLSDSAFKGILGKSTNAFEDLIKKDPEAVDIAEIDPATGAVIGYKKPTTQTANKTIEQVGAVALNPYNFFKDDSRKNLINDSIISAINSSLAEYNSRKVKPKDLLNRTYGIKNDVTILRDWFSDIHDKIMNVKIDDKTIENMGAGGINNLKTQIEAGLDGGNLDDLASRRFDLSQKALSRLTFGSYVLGKGGTPTPLLDFNGILDLLIARKGIKMTSPAAAAVAGTPAAGAPAAGTPAVGKALGGLIYASNGTLVNFTPRGTDTVPAMLTPGEFVVNRKATQENLPLLKSINSGQSVGGHYAVGGMVNSKTPTLDQNVLNKNNQKIQYKLVNIDKSIGVIDERTKKIVTYLDPYKQEAQLRSSGGIIYASNGALIPSKGSDTVPAMLTPGEFVVNKQSAQKNMGLLSAINRSRGGIIYAAEGMKIPLNLDKMYKEGQTIRKREMGELIEIIIPEQHNISGKVTDRRKIWVVNGKNLDIKKLRENNDSGGLGEVLINPYKGDPHKDIKPEDKHYWSWDKQSFPGGNRLFSTPLDGDFSPDSYPDFEKKYPNFFETQNPYGLFPDDIRLPPWGREPLPRKFYYTNSISDKAIPEHPIIPIPEELKRPPKRQNRPIGVEKETQKYNRGGIVYAAEGTKQPVGYNASSMAQSLSLSGGSIYKDTLLQELEQKRLEIQRIEEAKKAFEKVQNFDSLIPSLQSRSPTQKEIYEAIMRTSGSKPVIPSIGADTRTLEEILLSIERANLKRPKMVPNESFFANSPLLPRQLQQPSMRVERPYETELRILDSYHPDTTPGLDSKFYPNLLAFMNIITDIGEGLVAGGGGARGGGRIRPNRATPQQIAAQKFRTDRPSIKIPATKVVDETTRRVSKIGPTRTIEELQNLERKRILEEFDRSVKYNPSQSELHKQTRDAKLAIIDLLVEMSSKGMYQKTKEREGRSFNLKQLDDLPDETIKPYDTLSTSIEGLSLSQLKKAIDDKKILGEGANNRVFELIDGLALRIPKTSEDSILDQAVSIKKRTATQAKFESDFGGALADILDKDGNSLGTIISRASGVLPPSMSMSFYQSSKTRGDTALDTLSMLDSYSEDVFVQLFRDQLRLAESGYGMALADAKLANMVLGKDRIIPVDIGSPEQSADQGVGFPTSTPFRDIGSKDLASVVLSDAWLKTMEDQIIGEGYNLDRSIRDLIQQDPKAFLDRLSEFEYLPYEKDPRSNNEFILGNTPTVLYNKVRERILQKIRAAHKKVKTPSDESNQKETTLHKSSGGIIYASDGQLINFQPKGTDTVPAMLTPGEFVVNRKATQKNLPLLKSINNGANGYSRGGVVYLAAGGQLKKEGQESLDAFYQQALMASGNKWLITSKDNNKNIKLSTPILGNRTPIYNDDGSPRFTVTQLIRDISDSKYAFTEALNELQATKLGKDKYDFWKDNPDNYTIKRMSTIVKEYISNQRKIKSDKDNKTLGGGKDTMFLDLIVKEKMLYPQLFEENNPDLFNDSGDPSDKFKLFVKDPIKEKKIFAELNDRLNWLNLVRENLDITRTNLNTEKAKPVVQNLGRDGQTDYDNAIRSVVLNFNELDKEKQKIIDTLVPGYFPNIASLRLPPNRFTKNRFFAVNDPAVQNSYKNITQVKEYSRGGMVYAANGQYINAKPRGTDTVPAMLTPGEFVVNRKATQENFALLKSINDGAKASTYSRGGPVYLQDGGIAPNNKPRNQNSTQSNNISSEAQKFLTNFSSKIDSFGKYVQDLSNIKLPNKIEINIVAQPIEVRITGAAALEGMSEGIRNMVVSEVNQKMSKIWGQTDGAIGNNPATAQR